MSSLERRTTAKYIALLLVFMVSIQLLEFLKKRDNSSNNVHTYALTTMKEKESVCSNFSGQNPDFDCTSRTAYTKHMRRNPTLIHKINSTEVIQSVWKNCLRINIAPIQDVSILSQHYETVLRASEVYRNLSALSYRGFSGPSLEQHWITTFGKLSPHHFFPWVPLFIQWTDYGARRGYINRSRRYSRLEKWMLMFLRKDILYITVVQYDQGIGNLQLLFPNIVTISSGGYGYAKIPLLLRPLAPLPPPSRDSTLVSFTGSLQTHILRRKTHNMLRKLFGSSYGVYEGEDWMKIVNNSRFIVCPRGFARSAFKLYETIDLRRVPIYIYDDIPWLPYEKEIEWKKLAILVQFSKLHELPRRLRSIDELEYSNMINFAKNLHDTHFTSAGIMVKVGEFIRRPWSSSISCQDLPQTTG